MWKIILLMVVFEDDVLVRVVEPLPGTTFQTIAVCEEALAKLNARNPPPDGLKVKSFCIDPSEL